MTSSNGPSVPVPRLDAGGPVGELHTIRDWLRWGVSRFAEAGLVFGHGTSTALDEAAFLILETLRLPVDQLEPWLDARLTTAERQTIFDILTARVTTRKPASYLTGSAYIQGCRFVVDERVIVPRSYIGELLMTGGFDDAAGREPERVLDLCTGSGCLAILAALRFEGASVDAVELSRDAIEVAQANVAQYGFQKRVRILEGDLFAPVADKTYDLILANPPYVAQAEVDAFEPEYAAEPVMAHLGGRDGLDLVRRIIEGAAARLGPNGSLVVEVGTGREGVEAAFPDLPFVWLDTAESEGEVLMIGARELSAPGRGRRRNLKK